MHDKFLKNRELRQKTQLKEITPQ